MKANPSSEPGRHAVADPALPAEPIGDALSTPAASPTDLLPPGSARRQLFAAYTAAGAKVIAWVVAAAVVYRFMGQGPFARLMLLRATLGLLNYAAFGLGPAVLHYITKAETAGRIPLDAEPVEPGTRTFGFLSARGRILAYAGPRTREEKARVVIAPGETAESVFLHAFLLTVLVAVVGYFVLLYYDEHFRSLFRVMPGIPAREELTIWFLGLGVLARTIGDVAGGASHARGRFVLDQWLAALADIAWAVWCLSLILDPWHFWLDDVAYGYWITGAFAATARWVLAVAVTANVFRASEHVQPVMQIGSRFAGRLLLFGGLVTLGSVADFLYAPIDYVILNRLVDPLAVAVYAPAVQIDAALILLVNAIAAVILPRAAIRHAADDRAGVWREYVRGVVGAAGITLVGALLAWSVSGSLFELWLGDEMVGTQAILPLVLLHTVLGSGGGVGRSTMLAMGRAGTYAASVLAGGLLNILLSVAFVYAGLGLSGVILGTVISVALRCVLWMPWYIRRALKR